MDRRKDERWRRGKWGGERSQANFKKPLVAFINSLFSLPCECVDSSSGLFHICGERGGGCIQFLGPKP